MATGLLYKAVKNEFKAGAVSISYPTTANTGSSNAPTDTKNAINTTNIPIGILIANTTTNNSTVVKLKNGRNPPTAPNAKAKLN